MMSKKDFVAIAKIIKKRHSETTDTACRYGMELIVSDLEDVFIEINPRFDRDRFRTACFGE